MEDIRCRICDSAVSVVGMLGRNGHGGMIPGNSEVQLKHDESGHYFRCPYCSARNVTIVTTAGNGRPAVQVAWAVLNGD